MKTTHKTTRPQTPRPTRTRPVQGETNPLPPPPAHRTSDFLDFCLYPGMKAEILPMAYPTAV